MLGLEMPWTFQFSRQRSFFWDAGNGPELPTGAAVFKVLKVWSNSIREVWNLLEMQILRPHLLSQQLWDWDP